VTVRTYATPAAYKTALEARVAAEAKRRALPINRVRQLLVTERLLCGSWLTLASESLPREVWSSSYA
jgi:hypothetical protein